MKTFSILFILLPTLCHAASKPDPLSALVTKAVDEGEAEVIKPAMAEKLGFGPGPVIAQSIGISHSKAPDGQDHSFLVIVHRGKDGRPIPDAIEIRKVVSIKNHGDVTSFDGYIFRSDLSGHLEKAFHNSGPKGHLQAEALPVDTRKVKKMFEQEIQLFAESK